MSRFKLMLLSMLAVFAAGILASASASADACSGNTLSVFCFGSNNTPIHSETVLGESGLSLLHGSVGGAELKITCKDDKFKGTIELLGAGKGEIEFLGCSVVAPPNCSVTNPIIAKFTSQLSTGVMPATDLFTGSGPGEEFTILTVTGGSCALANTYTVTGLQTAELPSGETSLVEHEIVAKKAGSKLKLGTEAASFSSTAKVHLASSAAFLVMLGI